MFSERILEKSNQCQTVDKYTSFICLAARSNSVLLERKQNSQSKNFVSVEVSDWPSGVLVFILNCCSSSLSPQWGPSFSFGRGSHKSNFPDDGTPPFLPAPDTDAPLEPWHFAGAACSVVIYYSFPVREAETASEKNVLHSLEWGQCSQRRVLGKFTCLALCSVFSPKGYCWYLLGR